jgi:hypothetical protein
LTAVASGRGVLLDGHKANRARRAARPRSDLTSPVTKRLYVAANEAMLTAVGEVLAVWDGHPATVMGGTADVVTEARHRRLPVTILWPTGAARTEPASSRS